MSAVGSLRVEPPQTRVSFRPYGAEDDEWRYIGETPIENVRLPRGVFQWRLERDGFEPRLLAATNPSPLLENLGPPEFRGTPLGIQLSGAGEDEMIHVPGGAFPSPLAGLNLARVALDPFYIGRYEVTNEAFQEFVDQGGYESPEYWEHLTFFRDGVELSWEQAVAEFGDSTGQPGPSTWELGDYPPGEGSYPVRGVSWYEASAYADFRGGQRCVWLSTLKRTRSWLTSRVPSSTSSILRMMPRSCRMRSTRSFVRQASYAQSPLEAVIESTDESSEYWVRQKISFNASPGGERIVVHVYLPKQSEPPYQPNIAFQGAGNFLRERSSDDMQPGYLDFLVRDGRVLILPVYEGSFERWDGVGLGLTRERVVAWRRDLGRTLDYLETRDDMDAERVAYFGNSFGASAALPFLALEPRLRVAVLGSGGLYHIADAPPEALPINYVPRITVPLLMLNGRYDYIFPVQTSQDALFDSLGTPPEDKHRVIFDAGHAPLPQGSRIREAMAWLDKYLGPIN